jgi:hydroxyacylglutathione hydrolase
MNMAEGTFVHQFELGPWDNFIYLIGCQKTRSCAVVDPAWDADTIFREAEKLEVQIDHVLCTHSHFDHVDQVEAILARTDAQVHMLAEEIDFADFRCENLQRHVAGDRLTVGEHLEVTMMHTPGHTPGSTSYRIDKAIVTGDTLFVDGCGRCDFVGGDPTVMFETLRGMVDALPSDTVVYPGHNYGATASARLDRQLKSNPYLTLDTVGAFVSHRMEGKTAGSSLPSRPVWSPS